MGYPSGVRFRQSGGSKFCHLRLQKGGSERVICACKHLNGDSETGCGEVGVLQAVDVDYSKTSNSIYLFLASYAFFRTSSTFSFTWSEINLLFSFSNPKTKVYQLSTQPPLTNFLGSEGSSPLEVPNGAPKDAKTHCRA